MVFHRFDRQVFVETETTEGTANTPTAADFVECLEDITYTLNPFSLERPLVRPSFTKIPDYYASTGITTSDVSVNRIELTFTVELTSSGSAGGNVGNLPPYHKLLLACGMQSFQNLSADSITGGTITNGPIFHRESDSGTGGRAVSTYFTGDTVLYYTGSDPTTTFTGDVSGASCSVGGSAVSGVGTGYGPSIDAAQGDNSSATIIFSIDGRRFTCVGCRGNVVFNFTAMDRCLMTFTMQGIVDNIDDSGANLTGVSYNSALPPTFVGAGMSLMEADGSVNYTGAIFQQVSIDLGNEIIMREDANSPSGWTAARIIDRNPTMSMNPDAVAGGATSASVYDYIEAFAEGTPTRMALTVGSTAGNQFQFRVPAMQWSGVADGERDSYTIYDCSAKMTGGTNGDSVVHSGTGDTAYYDNKGADNELVILFT